MKKAINLIFLLVVSISTLAQTTVTRQTLPNLDTSVTTTVVSSVIKPFKLPAGGAFINGKLVTSSTSNTPLIYNGLTNVLISGKTIDLKNGSSVALLIQNCKVVHVTKCIFKNSTNDAIQIINSSNVLVDSCLLINTKAGVNAKYSQTVQVINNNILNMNGPYPSGNFVQFNNVNGGGNWINYNHCEDIVGVAQHPQDGISVYQSNGLPGDSIRVIGNWIRGGQVQHDSGGAAGIVLGDVGGSYQVARGNILVNPGAVGMQTQGGTHIKMDRNIIYSSQTPYTSVGMAFGNYSGKPVSDITYSNNKIKYIQTSGNEYDYWIDSRAGYAPFDISNIKGAKIDASILPSVIITYQ